MILDRLCPNCRSLGLEAFFEVKGVPATSCLLMPTREEAMAWPRGDVTLSFCPHCGFVTNCAFDPALTEYSARYEETQGFSPSFNAFHRALAARLIERHGLDGKTVVEIGCGKGEFLALLCEMGDCRGIGFDPAFVPERMNGAMAERLRFVQDFYSEQYAEVAADFYCCKMTLEHISQTSAFLEGLRRSIGGRSDVVVFFQVPDATRILQEVAFWDVYYEHCSYFTPQSLAGLFLRQGFEILDQSTDYGDQYLMIEARPAGLADIARRQTTHQGHDKFETEAQVAELRRMVVSFSLRQKAQMESWRDRLRAWARDGKRVVLWGSGSKGVAFLSTLGLNGEIERVVDINPHRRSMFMPGTGHAIVGPDDLTGAGAPDVVIVMNPLYRDEVARDLAARGLAPEIVTT